jgi:hypothetical protein
VNQDQEAIEKIGAAATKCAAEIKPLLEEAEAELQSAYRKVWPLREAYAEVTPPAALPARRNRTAKQDLIARCPRCGGRLEMQEPPEGALANHSEAE